MRMLIIEDDQDIQNFLKHRLEEKGFEVETILNGTDGMTQALTHEYDILLIDYSLPGKNGFEICEELRKKNIHTPIIIISATKEVPYKVAGLGLGADDYITKPFFFDELLARIQTVLRRPAIRRSSLVQVGNLQIDLHKQKVSRGNKPVYLTRKEFALLECLAKQVGDVVSRSTIGEYVWSADLDLFSNTIETHIFNLRKKIDQGYSQKLIHSIPGRGYKIDCER